MKRAPPKRVRRRADRVIATVWWQFFKDESTYPSMADVQRDRMGVSRDDSPVPQSLEDFFRTRIKQLVWLAEHGESGPLSEVVRRMAKECITDELRRPSGLKGTKRMQELAVERRERAEPVLRATDEDAKAKGKQLGRRDLALQARKSLNLDDPRKSELTERRARNYRKSPDKN